MPDLSELFLTQLIDGAASSVSKMTDVEPPNANCVHRIRRAQEVHMPQVDDIVGRPQLHFDNPIDVAHEPALSKSEKLVALSSWERDADHEEMATGEGMPPAPDEESIPVRQKIEMATDAISQGVRRAPTRDRSTIDPNRHVCLTSKSNNDDTGQGRPLGELQKRIVSHPIQSIVAAAAVGYLAALISGRG